MNTKLMAYIARGDVLTMPKVLSYSLGEILGEIKDALTGRAISTIGYQDWMSKLLNIKPKAITPDLPIEDPDNSLSMGDEHLDTISSVENLVPIPSKFEGISDDACDMPVGEDSSTFDALSDHSEILSDSNNDGTSSEDDDFEDIEYVSLDEVNNDQEEKEFDLEDILQIKDVILLKKLVELTNIVIEEVILLVPEDSKPQHGYEDSSTFVIRTFLPFLTYPADSRLLLSTGSEDTIFDPITDIKEMDKNKDKADKTEHENEKSARKRVQRCPSKMDIIGTIPVTHFMGRASPLVS
ncbi:hypothetical protein Tco_0968555 [Tanacetum coccineum]